MECLTLAALKHAQGVVQLPGSKSISNRTLLLAALAQGETRIRALLDSDDTKVMLAALQALGVECSQIGACDWQVQGCGGVFPVKNADLWLGNAGTALRPLTAALAYAGGTYTIRGVPRMHERPIGDLVDGLHTLGADIRYQAVAGYPPLVVHPATVTQRHTQVRGDVSSQFLTALLLTAPLLPQGLTIDVVGELISKPYIEITLNLMARFGVPVVREGWQRFEVAAASTYRAVPEIFVEGDASSASYFLAAGLLGGGPVRVEGVGAASIQGDVAFADALAQMGAIIERGEHWLAARAPLDGQVRAIDLDCNAIPDAAMTLAVCALAAKGTTTLRNIASWRVKETDRLQAMATELRKLGAVVLEGADFLQITPPTTLTPYVEIATYDDHRMAMCFSLVSLLGVPVHILDPQCVNKTFPRYFDVFAQLQTSTVGV